jgi:hypothetical protein
MTRTPQVSMVKHREGWRVASASTPGAFRYIRAVKAILGKEVAMVD